MHESYHVQDSLSSGGYPDNSVRENSSATNQRTLGYYSYVVVPPIQRVLNILLDTMSIGGCRPPLIRELAEQADIARGAVTDVLRQLATDGWILYDGRMITLVRDSIDAPDDRIDHVIDQDDDSEESAVSCASTPETRDRDSDRSRDRSGIPPAPPMVFNITTATDVVNLEASTIGGSGGIFSADRSADRSSPAALQLAELGLKPGRGVFERGMAAHTWMPQQIRDRYEYDQERIKNSNGTKHIGIFWTAFLAGELAPARPDPQRPLDPEAYANRDGFALGGAPPPGVDEPESIRDRALRLCGEWTAENHQAQIRDCGFLQGRLAAGDSDEVALAALDAYRKAVRR